MVCRMFVWCSLCVSESMLTVANALLMSSATVLCWFVLVKAFCDGVDMLCSAVVVEQ